MPCFTVFVVCPISANKVVNKLNNIYIKRHTLELRGYIALLDEVDNQYVYSVSLCDEDASVFLRDLLAPFFVSHIVYKYTTKLFYKNAHIQRPYVRPPRDNLLLKNIYWNAVSCERNMLDIKR